MIENKKLPSQKSNEIFLKGKLPPQAIELEESVLGAIINDSSLVDTISSILTNNSFYKDQNQKVFNAMLQLKSKFEKIDLLTVSQQLRFTGESEFVGGALYLSKLSNNSQHGFNTELHARIIQQMAIKRQLIKLASDIMTKSYEETSDTFDILGQGLSEISQIKQNIFKTTQKTNSSVLKETIQVLGNSKSSKQMTCGLPFLDSRLKLRKDQGKLIYIGARPSVVKSALIAAMMKEMGKEGIPVGCFSLEMSAEDIVNRMVVSELGGLHTNDSFIPEEIPLEHIVPVQNAIIKVKDLPIIYNDNPQSIEEICSIAQVWKAKHQIQVLFIDFIQKIGTEYKDPLKAISHCSNQLQKLKKDLKIPIICISSLNREAEKRGGKPSIADFRGSGDIESDADVVLMLWRPEDNELGSVELKVEGENRTLSTKNLMIGDFAKNRNGKKDVLAWQHDLPTNNFYLHTSSSFIKKEEPNFQQPIRKDYSF